MVGKDFVVYLLSYIKRPRPGGVFLLNYCVLAAFFVETPIFLFCGEYALQRPANMHKEPPGEAGAALLPSRKETDGDFRYPYALVVSLNERFVSVGVLRMHLQLFRRFPPVRAKPARGVFDVYSSQHPQKPASQHIAVPPLPP